MHCTYASCVSKSLGESILAIGEDFASSDAILLQIGGFGQLGISSGMGEWAKGFSGQVVVRGWGSTGMPRDKMSVDKDLDTGIPKMKLRM
nr:hypothetical protein [Tanacetum cinerariifolium]